MARGGAGDDIISGGEFPATLHGEDGNDIDTLTDGQGADNFVLG